MTNQNTKCIHTEELGDIVYSRTLEETTLYCDGEILFEGTADQANMRWEILESAIEGNMRGQELIDLVNELAITAGSIICESMSGKTHVDEASAAAMGRAVELDWTNNLEPSPSSHAVKHPAHAGTAVNNVARPHPAGRQGNSNFAVMHHDGNGWKVSKHERIETAAREFAKHAAVPNRKVKIVDGRGAVIHSTHEDVLLDDELQCLHECEFLA